MPTSPRTANIEAIITRFSEQREAAAAIAYLINPHNRLPALFERALAIPGLHLSALYIVAEAAAQKSAGRMSKHIAGSLKTRVARYHGFNLH